MNVFDITFVGGDPELQDEGWYGLWGEVTLGDHRESFLASLSPWSRADYERHWYDAALRLVVGEDRSAFFTSAFQFWFTAWREGPSIRIHEELLTPERLKLLGPSPDVHSVPYELVRPYRAHNDEGELISEWQVSLEDVAEYLSRRGERG